MQPSNEDAVYHMADVLASNLMNNSIGHAYPQLVPVLTTMGLDLRNVFVNMLGSMRQELFFGESPWAKLYELQTGKKIEVPDRTILKNICPDRAVTCGTRQWADIFKYFINNWENPEGDEEWHYFLNGPTDYNNQVVLNFDSQKATYYWENNDMELVLDHFGQSRGALSCPMFHTPYAVDVEYSYIQRTLLDPLLASMLEIWGIDPETVTLENDSKLLIHNHYYGDGKELPDESPIRQLEVLFDGSMFGYPARSYTCLPWREYRLQFSTHKDWNCNPSTVLKVAVMNKDNDHTVHSWWKNPLLVHDLLEDMDSLFDELLTKHATLIKEDPRAV